MSVTPDPGTATATVASHRPGTVTASDSDTGSESL